jgi:hypothetical protein
MKEFTCSMCGKTKPVQTSGGTGYGRDRQGKVFCYDCAADLDKKEMRTHGSITLYLTGDSKGVMRVSNWPGTLVFPALNVTVSRASAYGGYINRVDADFVFEGRIWHCIQKGNMDLCRCRKTKAQWVPTNYGGYKRRVRANPGRKSLREFIREHRQELDELIQRAAPGAPRSDGEREMWVRNDEGLYRWARSEGVRL